MSPLIQRGISAAIAIGVVVFSYVFFLQTGVYSLSALVFIFLAMEIGKLTISKTFKFLLPVHAVWYCFFYFNPEILNLVGVVFFEIVLWLWICRFKNPAELVKEEHLKLYAFLMYSLIAPTFILGHLNSSSIRPESALFLLGLVVVFDTASYFWGKTLGGKLFKAKLYPQASPAKTFEGAIFAVLTVIGLFFILEPYFKDYSVLVNIEQPLLKAVFVFLLCFFSLSGDLLESLLKRGSGVKDSGQFFVGHGGFYDRLDGLLFAGIISYLILQY